MEIRDISTVSTFNNPRYKLKEIFKGFKGTWYLDSFIEKLIFMVGGATILRGIIRLLGVLF